MRILILGAVILGLGFAQAQETPTPTPTPVPRLVRLHFAAPPLDGTISLGIYDGAGKLVRVLHREDTLNDFTQGHDALETTWDGADDNGHPLPAGRYHARGFLVSEEVKVEGVDSYFNDWATDEDSPHLAHISGIDFRDGALHLTSTTADGKTANYLYDPAQEKLLPSAPAAPSLPTELPSAVKSVLIDPLAFALEKDGSVWAISHVAKDDPALEVVQIAATPDRAESPIRRTLAIEPGAPQPTGIAASPNEDHVYLLEESPALQRVRSLSLVTTSIAGAEQAVSDWKVDFDKQIVAHQHFALLNGKPVAAPPNESRVAPVQLVQKLIPNALERDQPGKVTLSAGFDEDGSFLKTGDGLPLRTVSETPHLTRVLLARGAENAVDVFQDDGAVVEQFRISHLDQMLAFDCGDFELK